MALFDWLARKAQRTRAIDRASAADVIAATVRPTDEDNTRGYAQRPNQQALIDRNVKHTYVAVTRTAAAVASVPCRVYRRAAEGSVKRSAWAAKRLTPSDARRLRSRLDVHARKSLGDSEQLEVIDDPMHPAVQILERVNPYQSWYDHINILTQYLDLAGNAYVCKVYGSGSSAPWPVELWALQPQYTKVMPDQAMFIRAYLYGRGIEVEQQFDAATIIHYKHQNPADPYYGKSPLEAVIGDHDLSVMFTGLAESMIASGVNAGGVLVVKGTEDQRKQAELIFNQKYAGPDRYGRTVVLTGEATYVQNKVGEQEMAYLQSDKVCQETIANAYGMPPALLSLDSAALATAQAAIPMWQRMGIQPRVFLIQSKLNENLAPDFRVPLRDESLCFVFDNAIDKDATIQITNATTAYGSGLVTKNEARKWIDMDAVDEGDDFKAEPQPMGMPGAEPDEPGQDGTKPDDAEDAKPADNAEKSASLLRFVSMGAVAIPLLAGVGSVKALNLTPHAGHCCVARKATDPGRERDLEEALARWFAQYQTWAVTETATGGIGAEIPGELLSSFDAYVRPVVGRQFTDGYRAAATEVATRVRFQLPEVGEFLDTYYIKLRDSVMQTSEEAVRTSIAAGLEAGESPFQIAQRVRADLVTATPLRAEMIAATETARALNEGRLAAWQASGLELEKYWLLSGNPCPLCVALSEKFNAKATIPLGQAFFAKGETIQTSAGPVTNDYQSFQTPPVHPFCACDITYEVKA